MARILVLGAGVVGLGAALMLARDGHQLTVVERDPASPPDVAEDAWYGWERKGVKQFRQPHGFLPRFRQILESELPEAARALEDRFRNLAVGGRPVVTGLVCAVHPRG